MRLIMLLCNFIANQTEAVHTAHSGLLTAEASNLPLTGRRRRCSLLLKLKVLSSSELETQSVTPEHASERQGKAPFYQEQTLARTRPLLMADIRQRGRTKIHHMSGNIAMCSWQPHSQTRSSVSLMADNCASRTTAIISASCPSNENIMRGLRNVVAVYLDCPVLSQREALAKFPGFLGGLRKAVTQHTT